MEKEEKICKKLKVPESKLTPEERIKLLMSFRNEWKLYKRKCDATGEEILSAYHPDSKFKVYKNEYWWGDKWNALDYGRDFDFSRGFLDQFSDLQKVVPREGTSVFNCENCAYNSHIRESRNCYLNSLVYKCEDIYFSYWMVNNKDVFDSMCMHDSTLCYECNEVRQSYNCIALGESTNCHDCYFSYQLRGCDHCLFSSNLSNKSYYIYNKKCTEKEFNEELKKYINGSYKAWEEGCKKYVETKESAIHRATHGVNYENSTGDHIYNCKNCINCYDSFDSEDCENSISLGNSKDCASVYSAGWPGCNVVYDSVTTRGSTEIAFCVYTWFSSNLRYCESMNECDSCFGCIGLNHKQYCILNKQYTKEEYEILIPKIIEHMGETGEWGDFFPKNLSAFAYNETAAIDFFPMTEEEAKKEGFTWKAKDTKEYKPTEIKNIPDMISEINDDFISKVLACENCEKNYKIINQELNFYRKMGLPIPRFCPECRHKNRFAQRNPMKIFTRKCDKCEKEINSSYKQERKEKIFCEECYINSIQ